MVSQSLVRQLEEQANDCRKRIVKAAYDPGTHLGGALSAIDILTALYLHFLRVDPNRPDWPDRDRFILSKGHVALALYIVLAKKGFLALDDLKLYDRPGNHLGTHPSRELPGVELSSGSLGHGLSVGVGMALVGKRENRDYRVYVMIGDGELDEGSIYEAAMAAAKYGLDNLVAIIDRNMIQIDFTESVMPLGDVESKWKAFGWAAKVINGHSMEAILDAFARIPLEKGRPTVIIANTIKGKGVRFLEGTPASHSLRLTREERDRALKDLEDVS